MTSLIAQGYAQAKALTRAKARSFFFASHLLFGDRRRAAFALYAFCRRLDDIVDEPVDPADALPARLARARARVSSLYAAGDAGDWDPAEYAALRDTVGRFGIPEQPFQDLISGMEMDLTVSRYRTFADLDLYCYRVAGTVGVMLTHVLGMADRAALGPAADLGRAMQLTNILRDVGEDLDRGRIYLPQDELAAFGLGEADLAARQVQPRFADLMRAQVARARDYYARAWRGVPLLTGFGSRATVRAMGLIYGDILRVIERQGYDVFSARARVSGPRKLALLAAALAPERRPLLLPAPGARW